MRLEHPFFRLPLTLDVTKARQELLGSISEDDWIGHPSGFEGNSYLPLITYRGGINNIKRSPVQATTFASRHPSVMSLMQHFRCTIGIARLMRLEAGAKVPMHADTNPYWDKRVRVHIPLVTSEKVLFTCDEESVNMGEGEVWTFDNWRRHGVTNDSESVRIHLVFDVMGAELFDHQQNINPTVITDPTGSITFDQSETSIIASGKELTDWLEVLRKEMNGKPERFPGWKELIDDHLQGWKKIENEQGNEVFAIPAFQNRIKKSLEASAQLDATSHATNGVNFRVLFDARIKEALNLPLLMHDTA